MSIKEQIRAEIERLKTSYLDRSYTFVPKAMQDLLDFIDSLPDEKGGYVRDAEVIFNGHGLHTDVTKWADGYKLKIIIYDEY